eukprot:GEZU01032431.1.p1 GENE.GEZU01032431.1~~GEZU01032431.1.p1  ORF type:complete len:1094 (+),score=459.19 GEZU01032431.1:187-3468(+)
MSELEDVPQISFPKEEEKVLEYWNKIDAFKTSLKLSEGRPKYTFYDGPPFATGLPHYGHILAGTIKDIVTRYAHQTGHYVERRFGWDCHGLPIEFEIEKKLNIKTKEQVLAFGIDNYNEECRGIVMKFSNEWRTVVSRMGRWIDFDNDYKTMNPSFMESVWWVFKQLFEKNLVYRGYKVMPFSTACTTPLSNFEANLNYKDNIQDPAIYVSFPLEEDPETKLIAWTTTPWTLPSNLALCVNPDFDYVKIQEKESKNIYIVAECRLIELYKPKKKAGKADENPKPDDSQYTVLQRMKGTDLQGKRYIPLFDYFLSEREHGAFTILCDKYVDAESGTGVVHQAPGFGEDDYRVCLNNGIVRKGEAIVCPLDLNGRFTKQVPDFEGMYIKDADKPIIKKIKEMGRLVLQSTVTHRYPYCWRSETPLIYRAIPGWFVAVEKIKDDLINNNQEAYWVPEWVQQNRFGNWLKDARDWAVSRNRYWGTPIPIWASEDYEEIVCVGSIAELEELSGVKGITDIHRHKIDHITIPSRQGKGVLRRIEEVFDCWFESGSMPYAQRHYPFENKEDFENVFPADFIAEGIDQTRGWFYTLLVLGTALFNKCPFKNLIVNGLVLAKDGQKMSKSKRNYPDPMDVVNQNGADALRLYLINSPIVRGDNLKFDEAGVRDIVKEVFLPWFNAYRFFVQNARKFSADNNTKFVPDFSGAKKSSNVMDRWISSSINSLVKFVREEMAAYRLYTVVPRLVKFVDELTNWFVRMNRKRLKGAAGLGVDDWHTALSTLYHVLLSMARTMAPFTPYLTELMYQNLKNLLPEGSELRQDSIHYLMVPEVDESAREARTEEAVSNMQRVIIMGRACREKKKVSLKMPVKKLTVVHKDKTFLKDVMDLIDYVREELNVRDVEVTSDEGTFINKRAEPEMKLIGKRFGKEGNKMSAAIRALSSERLTEFEEKGELEVEGHMISMGEIRIIRELNTSLGGNVDSVSEAGVLVIIDFTVDQTLIDEGVAREIINRIQKLRKKAGLVPEDNVNIYFAEDASNNNGFRDLIARMEQFVQGNLHMQQYMRPVEQKPAAEEVIITEDTEVDDKRLTLTITKPLSA